MRKSLIILLLALGLAFLPVSCSGGLKPDPNVLPALSGLKLQGKLVFIQYQENGNQVVQLDLATGKSRVLFAAPDRSWLASAEVSPDGKQILLAYAPPSTSDQVQFGFTDLYHMPADGSSAPQPLLIRFNPNESFFMPTWSPDGQWIYYSHNAHSDTNPSSVEVQIERIKTGSAPEVLIHDAFWPRLSPDGKRLIYHSMKTTDSANELFIADADGADPEHLIQTDQPILIDAQLFSPDGKSVYFSMVDQPQSSVQPPRSWIRLLWPFGVKPVQAHTLPSDWFRVDVSGSAPQQMTHLQGTSMVACFSPDGQWMAIAGQNGLYVMKPDGSDLTQIGRQAAMGSVNWVK